MIAETTDFISRDVMPRQGRSRACLDRLPGLAAAPVFAIMALLTGIHEGNVPGMLCAAARDASPLAGMVPMYLLMSAFHSGPWLKLISSFRNH